MSERACETCEYWDLPEFPPIANVGQCRVRPPHPDERWPWTQASDWCGEWSPDETIRRENDKNLAAVKENMYPRPTPVFL